MEQYGRYKFENGKSVFIKDAFTFLLENTYHDNDFWMPITNLVKEKVIGFLKFKKVGEAMFVVDDIRSALCPMPNLQDLCKESLKCQQGHC